MKKLLKKILFGLLVLFLFLVGYFSIGSAPRAENISFGITFSQNHAQSLGLDWQETYSALLDTGVKKIKIATQWDLLEPEEQEYDFKDLDWQITKARGKEAEILLVIGMKSLHWPECYIPQWAEYLGKEKQQERILELLEEIVLRYKNEKAITMWQVENEPFFPFGECPWVDKGFLKKEIDLVKSLDTRAVAKGREEDLSSSTTPDTRAVAKGREEDLSSSIILERPVVISDSGERSFWITAAQLGDKVSTTLHRKVYSKELKSYFPYFYIRPIFYWRRAQIIEKLFGKEVIIGELQAEPWCPTFFYGCSLAEQQKTMNLELFKENIEFARETGLKEVYLWGGEWIYWLKEKQNDPSIWHELEKLLTNQNL
ncbi:MAG: beta-galactosidase [Candidatus Nealsonbacteria bacterium]|nr:beta-galactosidase [Candidatus Nealsonbacteria bacterium]